MQVRRSDLRRALSLTLPPPCLSMWCRVQGGILSSNTSVARWVWATEARFAEWACSLAFAYSSSAASASSRSFFTLATKSAYTHQQSPLHVITHQEGTAPQVEGLLGKA